jgi:hypothetical protein
MVLPQRRPQEVTGGLVKLEKVGHGIELLLGHLEGIETFFSHKDAPICDEDIGACNDASLPRFRDSKS